MSKYIFACIAIAFIFLPVSWSNPRIKRNQYELIPVNYQNVYNQLENGLNFVRSFYEQINLDGLLGVTLAESQLRQILKTQTGNAKINREVKLLIQKCRIISEKILPILPKEPEKMILFQNVLLKPEFWYNNLTFQKYSLQDLGIYELWKPSDILSNKKAAFHGISTDVCLTEVLGGGNEHKITGIPVEEIFQPKKCTVSKICKTIMFHNRVDSGYLLTHRLLYLQISRQIGCFKNNQGLGNIINNYCSLMLKEARTNEFLEFPQHDIFLEQVVLCGMEGFAEFLTHYWLHRILEWQTPYGCYTDNATTNSQKLVSNRRSTNVIEFGCTDHTTGLGIAALALNLRYIISNAA